MVDWAKRAVDKPALSKAADPLDYGGLRVASGRAWIGDVLRCILAP